MNNAIKAVVAGILTALTIMLLSLLFGNEADAKTLQAPVVGPASDGVMVQHAWFSYEEKPDAFVMFCVQPKENAALTCAVYVVADDKAAVVLVSDVKPTGASL